MNLNGFYRSSPSPAITWRYLRDASFARFSSATSSRLMPITWARPAVCQRISPISDSISLRSSSVMFQIWVWQILPSSSRSVVVM